MSLDVFWCALTNVFCLFPTVYAYRKGLHEWILYLSTGVVSVIYHLHHRDALNQPYITLLNYHAIRYTDLILSDLCVYWVVTDQSIKQMVLFTVLPFEIFVVVSRYPYIRLTSEIIWILVNIFYIFYKEIKVNRKKLYLALGTSFVEVIFYEVLTLLFPAYYNFVHGFHHIFGFLSMYFYMQKDTETTSAFDIL
jgi:hypothetical protein